MEFVKTAKKELHRRGIPMWVPMNYLNNADPTRTRFEPHFIAKV